MQEEKTLTVVVMWYLHSTSIKEIILHYRTIPIISKERYGSNAVLKYILVKCE